MKTKYRLYAYFIYGLSLFHLVVTMKSIKMTIWDLPYFMNEMIYLSVFGVFSLFILFKYDHYMEYLRTYASYLLIRFKKYSLVYHHFIKELIIESFILVLIKICIELILFSSSDWVMNSIYYFVVLNILWIHMNFELQFNSKVSLILIFIYLIVSLPVADLFYEMNIELFNTIFMLNMIFPSRIYHVIFVVLFLSIVTLLNYFIGENVLKNKEIL